MTSGAAGAAGMLRRWLSAGNRPPRWTLLSYRRFIGVAIREGAGRIQTISTAVARKVAGASGMLLAAAALSAGFPSAVASSTPLLHHMLLHILAMNVVAPLVAFALAGDGSLAARYLGGGKTLAAAATLQIALLWGMHAPRVLESSMSDDALGFVILLALLVSAAAFWASVLAQRHVRRWRAVVALLLTGKLFCLLAALLVFSPRLLYPGFEHAAGHAGAPSLSDQQLAGLVMIAICPLIYLGVAVWISASWLRQLGIHENPLALRAR